MSISKSSFAILLLAASCAICSGQKPIDSSIKIDLNNPNDEKRLKIVSYQNKLFANEHNKCFEFDLKYSSSSNKEDCHVVVDFDNGRLIASSEKWVIVVSNEYSFAIAKVKDNYSLLGVFPGNTLENFKTVTGLYGGGTARFLFPFLPYGAFKGVSIAFFFTVGDLLASPNVEILSLTNKENLISLNMKQIYKEGSHVPFSINSFTLDENRHYAIVKHLTEINKGKAAVTIRTERNYHDQIEGLPALLLKKVTMYSSYSGGKDLREESAQYSNFAKSTIPSEKMNLSHYGIPEPNFNQSPTRWPYYTFCLVALFTIGYFVFKRYAAKR